MRIAINQAGRGFDIKVNGIIIYRAYSQQAAMRAFNMLQSGKFLTVVKMLWKASKRDGYKSTRRNTANVILNYKLALQGHTGKHRFGGSLPISFTGISSGYYFEQSIRDYLIS